MGDNEIGVIRPDGNPVADVGPSALSSTLAGFMDSWQPRQRRTAGYQSMLFGRLDTLARAHPEWANYDLLTHTLAALHLIIEGDRLTGGQSRQQIVDELMLLVRLENPSDPVDRHRDLADSIIDLLLNTRERQARFRHPYMRLRSDGVVEHPVLSLAFVRATGDDDTSSPVLRPTPEAINIFQNFFQFDPSDRASAERYRSERMLHRRDYEEVISSIGRRSTTVYELRTGLEQLLKRIHYNIRDVDYSADVVPHLDTTVQLIEEQVAAEERFAAVVAEHQHQHAPDFLRLQRITEQLQELIGSLAELFTVATATRQAYEEEQDRQLFTHRRTTINPKPQLLEPLFDLPSGQVIELLEHQLRVWLGPVAPRVTNLQALIDKGSPAKRSPRSGPVPDPFDVGELGDHTSELDPALVAAVNELLATVTQPTSLTELLASASTHASRSPDLSPAQRILLPWAVAVTVGTAYTGGAEAPADGEADIDRTRVVVVRTGATIDAGAVTGDDLLILPAEPEPHQTSHRSSGEP
ncbi:hypothetical protein ACWEKR_08235 [Nocardia sp. NPDC004573]